MLPAARDASAHSVQFYESDTFLAARVAEYLLEGLSAGEPAVVVATATHRAALSTRLVAAGIDLPRAVAERRLIWLDAADTLQALLVAGQPDRDRFDASVGELVRSTLRDSGAKHMRAFGEMVDLLWSAGQRAAAMQLEQLWSALVARHPLTLLCAYTVDARGSGEVCAAHTHVLPDETASFSAHIDELVWRDDLDAPLRGALLQLRRAEQQARQARDDLEDFIEQAVIPIQRVDADGIIRWANAAELAMLGYTADEYVGHHVSEFHVDRAAITDILGRLARNETLREIPALVRAKDGRIRHLLISSNTRHRGGEMLMARCFSRDVTEAVAAERERMRVWEASEVAREHAEHANRAKDDFLAMLSHELRNPLSPILTAAQLMKLRGDRTFAREARIIERQVEHLIRLVDDLLDISRITRGNLELAKRTLRLRSVVTRAIEIAGPAIEARGHQLDVDLPDDDISIEADETRMCQVVTNLLTNAARYTPTGGRIVVRADAHAGRARIRVADNGQGLSAELIPRVFDAFVQGERTASPSGGLGLGLAIVRNLVAMHGGTVAATSDGPARGSEFVVELPLATPDAERGGTEAERALRERTGATSRRVLVVDDNVDAGEMLGELLQAVGHDVVVVPDGPRALEAVQRFSPEIAILDIGLPLMDGYELARLLRAQLRDLRLIAVSGYGQPEDHLRSEQAGFHSHLVKPIAPRKLLAVIDGD